MCCVKLLPQIGHLHSDLFGVVALSTIVTLYSAIINVALLLILIITNAITLISLLRHG